MSVGTPDFTRGVVSAQKLVGSFPHATTAANVTVPPNAETLVVVIPSAPAAQACGAAGLTTAAAYPAIRAGLQGGSAASAVFFIDVSSATDPTVQVNIAPAAPGNWFVYADAGTHLTADIGGVLDSQGKHFHVPVIPSGTSFDHPPIEMLSISPTVAAGATILAPPGAIWRYRVFSITMASVSAGLLGGVVDNGNAKVLLFCAGVGNAAAPIPSQGYPLAANGALTYAIATGAGNMSISVLYTQELV